MFVALPSCWSASVTSFVAGKFGDEAIITTEAAISCHSGHNPVQAELTAEEEPSEEEVQAAVAAVEEEAAAEAAAEAQLEREAETEAALLPGDGRRDAAPAACSTCPLEEDAVPINYRVCSSLCTHVSCTARAKV